MQRHHLLPRQLLSKTSFARLFDAVGRDEIGYEDFRVNGLLLPSSEGAAQRMGLPMHRGPHRAYNAMVIERIGQIEHRWAQWHWREPRAAREEAQMRIGLLQRALRRRLLDPRRQPIVLHSRDRMPPADAFGELDAMADALWDELEEFQADEPDSGAPAWQLAA